MAYIQFLLKVDGKEVARKKSHSDNGVDCCNHCRAYMESKDDLYTQCWKNVSSAPANNSAWLGRTMAPVDDHDADTGQVHGVADEL